VNEYIDIEQAIERKWLRYLPRSAESGRVLYALVYTKRSGEKVRVISLRKATPHERKAYNEARSY
jgi:uncharacterized DUF497 family protein